MEKLRNEQELMDYGFIVMNDNLLHYADREFTPNHVEDIEHFVKLMNDSGNHTLRIKQLVAEQISSWTDLSQDALQAFAVELREALEKVGPSDSETIYEFYMKIAASVAADRREENGESRWVEVRLGELDDTNSRCLKMPIDGWMTAFDEYDEVGEVLVEVIAELIAITNTVKVTPYYRQAEVANHPEVMELVKEATTYLQDEMEFRHMPIQASLTMVYEDGSESSFPVSVKRHTGRVVYDGRLPSQKGKPVANIYATVGGQSFPVFEEVGRLWVTEYLQYECERCGERVESSMSVDLMDERLHDSCPNHELTLVRQSSGIGYQTSITSTYQPEEDLTFVMEEIKDGDGELVSLEVTGFYFGEPDRESDMRFNGKRKAEFF